MSRAFRKYHKSLQTTRVSRTAVEGLPYSEMGRANLPSSVKRAKKEAATTFFSSRQFTRSAKSSAPQWTAMPHSWPLLCPSPKSVLRFSRSPPLVLTDRNDKQIVKTGSWREQSEGSREEPPVRFPFKILLLPPPVLYFSAPMLSKPGFLASTHCDPSIQRGFEWT